MMVTVSYNDSCVSCCLAFWRHLVLLINFSSLVLQPSLDYVKLINKQINFLKRQNSDSVACNHKHSNLHPLPFISPNLAPYITAQSLLSGDSKRCFSVETKKKRWKSRTCLKPHPTAIVQVRESPRQSRRGGEG